MAVTALCFTGYVTATPLTVTAMGGQGLTTAAKSASNIAAAGGMTAAAITKAAMETATAITTSSSDVNKSILQATLKDSMDTARLTSMQTKMEMDYKSELANKKIEDQRSSRKGDTKADIEFVLKFLEKEDVKKMNVSKIIAYAKTSLDGKDIIVQPSIDVDNSCKGSDGKNTCGFKKKLEASNIIEYYATLCSGVKRQKYKDSLLLSSSLKTKAESARSVKKWVSQTNSNTASSTRLKKSLEVSCTPELLKAGICNGGVEGGDKQKFAENLLKNKIIPSGDVSALNFYSPLSVGGYGYVDMSSSKNKALAKKMKDEALEHTTGGTKGVPTIVDTYRNSSQLRAAMDFANNVVNMEAVSNQVPGKRLMPSSVKFQNRFLSRVAGLDLAKSSFDDSIAERRGAKLSNLDPYNLHSGEFVKERSDGASYIDIQRYDVEKAVEAISPNNIGRINQMTPGQLDTELYKAQVRQNSLLFDRLLKEEKGVLLLSTLVSNEVNSPENVRFIKSIGR
ncbi:hypothetical protein [Photobacterium kishitanii]|uniref:hypothetical protein n=1 Tax=Photobacterium kishitanii TaxID=318456 RepID=UPI0011B21F48|nr:hypothetical protein [Photobacterium kishitanii]